MDAPAAADSRLMGGVPATSRFQCLDVWIAVLRIIWIVGWVIVDFVRRASGQLAPPLSLLLALFVVAGSSIELPFVYGLAKGRRWGFIGLAVLSAIGVVGSFTTPLMVQKPITENHVLVAVVDAALLLYTAVRLFHTRVPRIDTPRPRLVGLGDTLLSTVGAAWALGFAALILGDMIKRPIRPFELGILGSAGLLGGSYLISCVGVGLGRRWGFGTMFGMSLFGLLLMTHAIF